MQTLRRVLFVFLSLITYICNAQVKYSNEFLSIGVGARGLAMGGAQVATTGDATSGYWNPAGILGVQSNVQIAAMHSEYFAGIAKYDFGSFVVPRDATRAIGFTIIRFGVDDIPDTTELIDASGNINYDKLKSFSAADYAFMFTYAKAAKKVIGLSYGGNVKIIHRIVGDFAHAWGFGLDFGAQYKKDKWQFGAVGQDITSTFNAWSFNTDLLSPVFSVTNNEIPQNSVEVTLPKLILGGGYKTNISSKITWLTELDLVNTFDGKRNTVVSTNPLSIDPRVGFEFGYDDFIFLRGGINNIQRVKDLNGTQSTTFQPNLGVGFKLKTLTIDYALTNIGEDLYSNVFSLKLDIYKHK